MARMNSMIDFSMRAEGNLENIDSNTGGADDKKTKHKCFSVTITLECPRSLLTVYISTPSKKRE